MAHYAVVAANHMCDHGSRFVFSARMWAGGTGVGRTFVKTMGMRIIHADVIDYDNKHSCSCSCSSSKGCSRRHKGMIAA